MEKTNHAEQLKRLKETVAECLDVQELTPLMLNKLIDRIELGNQEVVGRAIQQGNIIVWRFVRHIKQANYDS